MSQSQRRAIKSDRFVHLSRKGAYRSPANGSNRMKTEHSAQRRKSCAHPNPRSSVPVSETVYHHLLKAICDTGYQKEGWEIAEQAIDEWVRRHNPDHIPLPATKGYQWKRLFLPDGTLLRTVFVGKNHHCLVENDGILYNGKAVSPSGFVNAVGGIRRNAWHCTWILLPDNKEWQLADALRSRERPRHQRNPILTATQATAGHAGAASAPVSVATATATAPVPAQAAISAASTSGEQSVQASRPDKIERSDSNPDRQGVQRRGDTALFSPRCRCGAERRSRADDRMAPLLRDELRGLLDRMRALDEERREVRACPDPSTQPK